MAEVSDAHVNVSPISRTSEVVLAVSHGRQTETDERKWNFPSKVESVVCRYLERWLPLDATAQRFTLRNVYFYLFAQVEREADPRELLAFHWEPTRPLADGQDPDLRRPHLHLTVAPRPLPKSHFCVTLTVASRDQSSVDYLDTLVGEALRMVKVEVLDRVLDEPLRT